jgi:hypothetical protein
MVTGGKDSGRNAEGSCASVGNAPCDPGRLGSMSWSTLDISLRARERLGSDASSSSPSSLWAASGSGFTHGTTLCTTRERNEGLEREDSRLDFIREGEVEGERATSEAVDLLEALRR